MDFPSINLDHLGGTVSAAARPASSVPAKANAAVTKTAQIPLNPLLNDPGFCQYVVPYTIPLGEPPRSITMPMMMNPMTAMTLTTEKINSASPYPRTPAMLIHTIATQKMVMKIAPCNSVFQKRTVKPAATSSNGNTVSH